MSICVRKANENDDFFKIAQCIYLTDHFIYPAAFGKDIHRAAKAISQLADIKNGLFSRENIAVALCDGEICGALLYNGRKSVWDTESCVRLVSGTVPDINSFRAVSDKYFILEAAAPPENSIELVACCTLPDFRGMGIGKSLIKWLTEEYSGHFITLDVLADNSAAIGLYKKYGFEITESYKGFSIDENTRPDCFHMIRQPHI